MNTETINRDPALESDWASFASQFKLRPDTIYLNHGSFGLPPNVVRYERRQWIERLDEQPMDFYLRQMEPAIESAKQTLATFVGTSAPNLIFVDNATYGMNIVARSLQLKVGDEILLNNHEYGAVHRIWSRICEETGAQIKIAELPTSLTDPQEVVDCIANAITEKTKLVICSHITSATALILPLKQICRAVREKGCPICIDGPHAPVQVDIELDDLDCDFYTASCHKWLCATLGSGFLYVHPRQQDSIEPPVKSWGRLKPAIPERWDEEFTWIGSRDPSPFLSIPRAIEFMQSVGIPSFRARSQELAAYSEAELCQLFETNPIGDRTLGWYRCMTHVPLPNGDWSQLQKQLWEQVGIEVMINTFGDRWFVRVSHHLYNNKTQLDTLVKALHRLVK